MPILFEAEATGLDGLTGDKPAIHFTHGGKDETLTCDIVAGCDGFHGICRAAIPDDVLKIYDREFPFGWLGILSESPPLPEMTYANHERGFALASRRSPHVSRLYVQCSLDDDVANWSDARSGTSCTSGSTTCPAPKSRRAASSRGASRRAARSSRRRCATAGCSSPATPATSCRRPAPRASTSRSPTCACCPAR